MKSNETIESNKLIAIFMNFPTELTKGRITNELAANLYNDWNSLMPVINKIIKLIGVKSVDECTKEEWFQSTRIVRMYIGIDILTAHFYVTEFIKWYNNENKS